MAASAVTPGGRSDRHERFGFVRKGASVRVTFGRRTAIELAAYGVEESDKALGREILAALRRGEKPVAYSGTVEAEPPSDRMNDPMAPVAVAIPELDDSGDLFVVTQQEIQGAEL
jgi:hypothetical protein